MKPAENGSIDIALPRQPGERPLTEIGRRLWALLRYRFDVILSVVMLAAFVFIALFPQLVTPFDPLRASPRSAMQPPSLLHPFGTDNIGRDVFARVAYGAGASLRAAAFAVVLSSVLGGVLGVLAGAIGGWIDSVISRLFEALLAIPHLLLILALLTVFGNGVDIIALGIGIAGSVSFGRVMRAQIMRIRTLTYVEAAVASGVKPFGVVVRYIVPNALTPLAALATLEFGTAMLTIGAMSYLGFGQAPPTPEWGRMIAQGQAYLQNAPWLSVLPGLMFVVVVVALSRVSRAIGSRHE
jgi:peptide/nickel transport system permease protein